MNRRIEIERQRKTEKDTDRKIEIYMNRVIDRDRERQTETEKNRNRMIEIYMNSVIDKEREKEKERRLVGEDM